MRRWTPTDPPRDIDPRVYAILKGLNQAVAQFQSGFANLDRGTTTDGAQSQIGATDHGALDGLAPEGADTNDDHPQYFLLSGRSGGQTALGDSTASSTSTTPVLILANFNSSTSSGAQRITLRGGGASQGDITIETPQLAVKERAAVTAHFNILPTATLVRMSHNGTATFTGQSADGYAVIISSTGNAAVGDHNLILRSRSGQTGDYLRMENSASTRLSYIRASDGAWVGPVVAATTDDHPDNVFRILGSVDPTKIVAFEVDGLTTATTRTITVPDVSATLLLTTSASDGQHIGAGTKPTGGNADDLSTYARVYVGSSALEADAQLTGNIFSVKKDLAIDGGIVAQSAARILLNLTGSGAGAGIYNALEVRMDAGNITSSSGSVTFAGLNMPINVSIPTGVTSTANGILFDCNIAGGGSITSLMGGKFLVGGSTTGAASTLLLGIEAGISNRGTPVTSMIAYRANGNGTISAAVTNAVAYEVSATFANDTDVVTWSGLRISTGITAAIANKWSLDLTNTSTNMGSRIAHKMGLGWNPSTVSAITARVMLAAGTATASTAPLKFQSGTSLTAAEAGAMEFTTDDFFLTITTGAARKGIILDDGSRLTSGRVPFATTNGRLIDDADFTFATDTLTITKIAATTLTGDLTLADAINIPVGSGTGTKIATATTQKIGFWNAAPIAQPTTGIAAATFVTNTSLIANDSATFDGYTLGQVVKALRNAGLLA